MPNAALASGVTGEPQICNPSISIPSLINTVALLSNERLDESLSRKEFMISRDTTLEAVWQLTQPGIKVLDCAQTVAEKAKVAGMDQDVTVRHMGLSVKFVRVRENHEAK
jgi:hypothetical protein